MQTVGERVRWARERAGLTQADLARASGVSVAALHRIEHGETKPRPTTASKLAKAFRVRVEWLTVGDAPMLWTADMTMEEQHKVHNGPGTEGLPGYVVFPDGRWYRDESGEWQVEPSPVERKGD